MVRQSRPAFYNLTRNDIFEKERLVADVLVIGGGLAGLAATVALAERGVSVTLIESRPRLGGRASSFTDPATNTLIDNCQHVSMGCCTNYRQLCETIGAAHHFREESTLFFIGPDGEVSPFSDGWLPAPLHLLPAFRQLKYFSKAEKKQLRRGLLALGRLPSPSARRAVAQPFSNWLIEQGQSARVRELFWHVVLVSALSETLDRIDTDQARKVFFDGFLAHRAGWRVQIPAVPLGELYGQPLLEWLAANGAECRLSTGLTRLHVENRSVASAELRSGKTISAENYILAIPHHRVGDVFPAGMPAEIQRLTELESAPISSVHLWFDRPITELPHAVFVGRLSQWLFNRTQLQKERDPQSHYYQIVISGSRELAGRTQEEIIAEVVRELGEIWPDAEKANRLSGRVVTEHKAVFSVQEGADALRPPQQSSLENLQWAGDWTRTGWPATMEGAVRSGYLAAENVLEKLGRPARILVPDLPVSRLTRLLLGNRHET